MTYFLPWWILMEDVAKVDAECCPTILRFLLALCILLQTLQATIQFVFCTNKQKFSLTVWQFATTWPLLIYSPSAKAAGCMIPICFFARCWKKQWEKLFFFYWLCTWRYLVELSYVSWARDLFLRENILIWAMSMIGGCKWFWGCRCYVVRHPHRWG